MGGEGVACLEIIVGASFPHEKAFCLFCPSSAVAEKNV